MPKPDPFAALTPQPAEEKKSIFNFAIRSKKKQVPVAKVDTSDKENKDNNEATEPTEPTEGETVEVVVESPVDPPLQQAEEVEEKHYVSPFRRFTKQSSTKPKSTETGLKIPSIFSKLDSKHQKDIYALELENKRLGELKKQHEDALAKDKEDDAKKLEEEKQRLEELKAKAEEAKKEAEGPKKEEPDTEAEAEPVEVASVEVEETPIDDSAVEEAKAEENTKTDAAAVKAESEKTKKPTGPKKHRFFGLIPLSADINKRPDGSPMTVQDKIDLQNKEHQSKLALLKKKAEDEFNRVQHAYDNQIDALKAEISKIEERMKTNEDDTHEHITKAQTDHEDKTKELAEKHEEDKNNLSEEAEQQINDKHAEVEQSKKDQIEASEHLKELEDKQVESSEKLRVFEQDVQALRLNILNEKGKCDDANKENESKIQDIEDLKQQKLDYEAQTKEAVEKAEESKQVISDYENNTHQAEIDAINEQISKLSKELEETKKKSEEARLKREQYEAELKAKEENQSEELKNKSKLDTLQEAAEDVQKNSSKKVEQGEKELDALKRKFNIPIPDGFDPADEAFKKDQSDLVARIEEARKKRESLAGELLELNKDAYSALPKDMVA